MHPVLYIIHEEDHARPIGLAYPSAETDRDWVRLAMLWKMKNDIVHAGDIKTKFQLLPDRQWRGKRPTVDTHSVPYPVGPAFIPPTYHQGIEWAAARGNSGLHSWHLCASVKSASNTVTSNLFFFFAQCSPPKRDKTISRSTEKEVDLEKQKVESTCQCNN